MQINWYNKKNELLTEIFVSKDQKDIKVVNHAKYPLENAFGIRPVEEITYDDVYRFLARRTCSPNFAGLKRELRAMGLRKYDPIAMCKKTNGRMCGDDRWLEIL